MKNQIPVKIMFTQSFQVTKCGVHQNYPYLKVPIVRRNPSSCILWHFPRLADISDSARTTTGRLTLQVREAIKKASFFWTMSKRKTFFSDGFPKPKPTNPIHLFQQALAAIVCRLSLELATRRKPTGFTRSGNTMVSVLYMYETSWWFLDKIKTSCILARIFFS